LSIFAILNLLPVASMEIPIMKMIRSFL
jgi:hypothetical protein